jgi:hypothetical protein
LVDGARQERHGQRAPAHEANLQLFADRQDVRFRVARHYGVFVLNRRNGLDRVRAAKRLRARFGEAEMQNLPFRDQIPDSPCDVLDRDGGIDTVLIEEINAIRLESLQHAVNGQSDVVGPAVKATQHSPGFQVDVPAKLRGDHHLIANGS